MLTNRKLIVFVLSLSLLALGTLVGIASSTYKTHVRDIAKSMTGSIYIKKDRASSMYLSRYVIGPDDAIDPAWRDVVSGISNPPHFAWAQTSVDEIFGCHKITCQLDAQIRIEYTIDIESENIIPFLVGTDYKFSWTRKTQKKLDAFECFEGHGSAKKTVKGEVELTSVECTQNTQDSDDVDTPTLFLSKNSSFIKHYAPILSAATFRSNITGSSSFLNRGDTFFGWNGHGYWRIGIGNNPSEAFFFRFQNKDNPDETTKYPFDSNFFVTEYFGYKKTGIHNFSLLDLDPKSKSTSDLNKQYCDGARCLWVASEEHCTTPTPQGCMMVIFYNPCTRKSNEKLCKESNS